MKKIEKQVSLEDAFQVWWFIAWRTILVVIGINVLLSLLLGVLGTGFVDILRTASLVVAILVQVFFLKSALNRDYKNFRLSVIPPDGQ